MDDDSKIIFFRQPDALELNVRLVCGGILGVVFGLAFWVRYRLPLLAGAAVTLGFVVSCAYGARKYGDSFWYDTLGSIRRPWNR